MRWYATITKCRLEHWVTNLSVWLWDETRQRTGKCIKFFKPCPHSKAHSLSFLMSKLDVTPLISFIRPLMLECFNSVKKEFKSCRREIQIPNLKLDKERWSSNKSTHYKWSSERFKIVCEWISRSVPIRIY